MKIVTLCYIEKDDEVLFLLRNKKKNDLNANKYIGVGGKLEKDESPFECIKREVLEETGLILNHLEYAGLITFILPKWENELCFVYLAKDFEGKLIDTNEGELIWVKKNEIMKLNLWEGDKIFLPLLFENKRFFTLKLEYDLDDKLVNYTFEN